MNSYAQMLKDLEGDGLVVRASNVSPPGSSQVTGVKFEPSPSLRLRYGNGLICSEHNTGHRSICGPDQVKSFRAEQLCGRCLEYLHENRAVFGLMEALE